MSTSSTTRLELSELPPVLLAHALEFADLRTLLSLECTSPSLQQIVHDFHLWRTHVHLTAHVALQSSGDALSAQTWKQLALLAALPSQGEASLLESVRACSSVDNPGESPSNTLVRSSCETDVDLLSKSSLASDPVMLFEWARRIQVRCGCARGRPCYWSTSASWKHTEQDLLEYAIQRDCVVSSVSVTPYRVFWYPGHPTYSPLQLSFSFHELLSSDSHSASSARDGADAGEEDDDESATVGPVVYESPVYDVVSDMKLQTFALPRKVVLRRGVMRLHLFGRQQDLGAEMMEWNRENDMAPYYICLSYVGAAGRVLERE